MMVQRLPLTVALMAAALAEIALFSSPAGAESVNRALRAAVESGDADQVRQCLAEGADPGARFVYRTVDSPKTTVLSEAIRKADPAIMRLLLRASPDATDVVAMFPHLYWPNGPRESEIGRVAMEELVSLGRGTLLLEHAHLIKGEKALRVVMTVGPLSDPRVFSHSLVDHSWETVRLLFDSLPDPRSLLAPISTKQQEADQVSSLPWSCVSRISERLHDEERLCAVLQNLRMRGMPQNPWGEEALTAAKEAGKLGLWKLAKQLDPTIIATATPAPITDEDRLASALANGDEAAIAAYRAAGVAPRGWAKHALKRMGPSTLLTKWVAEKRFDLIEQHGINPDDWIDSGDDPFLVAKDSETVRWLLEQKVSVTRNPTLLSSVLASHMENKLAVIELLAKADAPMVQEYEGHRRGVLSVLATGGFRVDRVAVAKLLMSHGADPAYVDSDGKTALQWAEEMLQIDLLEAFDPKRKAPYWARSITPNSERFTGAWSNGEGEFKTISLMLRPNGLAILNGAVGGAPAVWKGDPEGRVTVQFFDINSVDLATKMRGAFVFTPSASSPGAIESNLGGTNQVLKRVMDGAALEKALIAASKPPPEDLSPVPRPKQDPAEVRRLTMELIRSSNAWDALVMDWPDETLPDDFRNPKLNSLRIMGGNLRHLPDDLPDRFPNLTMLAVSNLALLQLPENLDQLPKLKELTLTSLRLDRLPPHPCARLTRLNLRDNRLAEVPEAWLVPGLESLELADNRLARFSLGEKTLNNLRDLDLAANSLTDVSLGQMPQLDGIDLSENRLSSLPKGLEDCSKLEFLNLSANRLAALPDKWPKLPVLRSIQLEQNRFPDPEAVERRVLERLSR